MASSPSHDPRQNIPAADEAVLVQQDHEASAMNDAQRFKKWKWSSIRRCRLCCYHPLDDQHPKKREDMHLDSDITGPNEDDEILEERLAVARQSKQHRLDAVTMVKRSIQKRICSILTCFVGTSTEFGVNSSQTSVLARSLHWSFRVNIFVLFTLMCTVYYGIGLAFGGLIVVAGVSNPKCIYVGSSEFGTFGSRFYDAFFLSWTTLGTVGYGAVYPALSNQNNDNVHCAFITAITSFETLVGILYAGFCGAMLFAKVLRVQLHAQVMFSDPLVIRYGCGVEDDDDRHTQPEHHSRDEGGHRNPNGEGGQEKKQIPLPVLEFRIVNRNSDQPGGEIIDARLNVVANVDAQDAEPSTRDALDPEKRWKRAALSVMQSLRRSTSIRLSSHPTDDIPDESSEHVAVSSAASLDQPRHSLSDSEYKRQASFDSTEQSRSTDLSRFVDPYSSLHGGSLGWDDDEDKQHRWRFHMPKLFHRDTSYYGHDPLRHSVFRHHVALDEDPETRLVTKRIFSKMHLEASDHPFFKRVWLVRHVLNEHSPIVKPRVRRLIRRNHGHWPEELNSHHAVRESLSFNQIVVSFHGVCNISAAKVFAQKIYDHVDLSVGYQFVSVIFRNPDGGLQVDTDLINDVVEQNGGGGEQLLLDI